MAKFVFAWAGLYVILFALCFIIAGCASTDPGTGPDVLDSAKQLGELSEQNRQLTERVEREQELYNKLRDSLGRAEADAASAADDIRGAIKLLTEYKYRLDEYFKAVDSLQRESSSTQ